MVHPKISIALCTYNGEKYLTAQLDSILDQTHPADEIIIVDDGSTDATLDIIREYASRTDILQYFVNEQTLGYVRNFSKAISLTSGDFVALSDQDDIWTKDHIEKLLNNIGGKAVCVGDSIMIDAQGKETGERFSDIKQNYYIPENDVQKAYRIVFNYNPYQGASMLIDRKWVDSYLPIPVEAGYHDTFLAGCASLTQGLSVIPDAITKYRIHEGQVTSSWRVTVFDEIKHRRHFICFPSKPVIIDRVLDRAQILSLDASAFINEFKRIMDLDKQNKRLKILRIKNRHYKEIYSSFSYRHILLRSLHFLLSL
jgi:glycosyltransferase involved in cell wall biosynthesis